MNAVAPDNLRVMVCPNCRAENSLSAAQCLRCNEDLPPSTPVSAAVSNPDSAELPITVPASQLRVELPRPSSRNLVRQTSAVQAVAKLKVIRGKRLNQEFQLYEGANVIGRCDERPVDIDVSNLESPDKIWSSRRHAVIAVSNGRMTIEDLNSMNGTFVNRRRVAPSRPQPLSMNDVVQIGTIQFKVII